MQKRLLLSFVFLLGLITNVLAQSKGVISGTVRDEDSGETLIGVSIYEEKLQLGTTTDEKGRYELELPFGEHTLRVSYVGYSTINKRVNIGNKPVTLNLKLESEQKKLSEVEVTSERKDRNVTGTGGWGVLSPYMLDRLAEFGVYNPIKDLIDNEKAFYVGNKNIKRLTEYYNKWYGTPETTIYMDQVDEVDGRKIWSVKTTDK